ncbi:hypothetical protein TrCOL_g5026 [Triparma columacea]|uniref:Uncharacterized protein n=1 Tax=Triparma columacea TaxID=722753 RepID=A0A9W7GA70_9STRA|nr:hypothetical protein TrCOL_g5026 [Triparma columacea]
MASPVTHLMCFLLFGVVGQAMITNLDFKSSLGFYAAYHQDPYNQLIHFIFIPLIWWSINVWMCYVPLPLQPSSSFPLTYGTVMLLMYGLYYVALDGFTGGIFTAVLAALYMQAQTAVNGEKGGREPVKGNRKGKGGGKMSWGWFAFWVHLAGWVMQIGPGHGYFEGVKPALLDSLGQALGVAPLFAFLEGLWAVGVAGELKGEVMDMVAIHRRDMCTAGGAYPWC